MKDDYSKRRCSEMLDKIPDDASYEDIQYHIYVQEKIRHGLKDIEEGNVLNQEEVEAVAGLITEFQNVA